MIRGKGHGSLKIRKKEVNNYKKKQALQRIFTTKKYKLNVHDFHTFVT